MQAAAALLGRVRLSDDSQLETRTLKIPTAISAAEERKRLGGRAP